MAGSTGQGSFTAERGVSDGQTAAGVLRVMDSTCLEEERKTQYFPKMRV